MTNRKLIEVCTTVLMASGCQPLRGINEQEQVGLDKIVEASQIMAPLVADTLPLLNAPISDELGHTTEQIRGFIENGPANLQRMSSEHRVVISVHPSGKEPGYYALSDDHKDKDLTDDVIWIPDTDNILASVAEGSGIPFGEASLLMHEVLHTDVGGHPDDIEATFDELASKFAGKQYTLASDIATMQAYIDVNDPCYLTGKLVFVWTDLYRSVQTELTNTLQYEHVEKMYNFDTTGSTLSNLNTGSEPEEWYLPEDKVFWYTAAIEVYDDILALPNEAWLSSTFKNLNALGSVQRLNGVGVSTDEIQQIVTDHGDLFLTEVLTEVSEQRDRYAAELTLAQREVNQESRNRSESNSIAQPNISQESRPTRGQFMR